MCVCVCVCVYIYIHTHTHTHIHTYISVLTVYIIIIRNHKGMSHLEIMSVYCLRVTADREGKKTEFLALYTVVYKRPKVRGSEKWEVK